MVAVIKTGSSVQRIVHYNENKVTQGVARCIGAVNYPATQETLSLGMKLNRLLRQNALNSNVTRNSVHISLNFDPRENNLGNDKLMEIAGTYMEKIGFGQQPWLAYRHHDAGHPHIHIVSIKVGADGSRIDMQNIGKNASEKARREIEIAYGLVRVQGTESRKKEVPDLSAAVKVQYGKMPTKRAIANAVTRVTGHYKYASLAEFNAALRQYNVVADRGDESSRTFKKGGLLYRALDENGNKTGVPIKASSLYNAPTLSFLEKQFVLHEIVKAQHRPRLKNSIDTALGGAGKNGITAMVTHLEKQGIATVLRQNAKGDLYGITYVDHVTGCVCNGSSLGKAYSAKGILERCGEPSGPQKFRQEFTNQQPFLSDSEDSGFAAEVQKILEVLSRPEFTPGYLPQQLKGKKKKRRKGK